MKIELFFSSSCTEEAITVMTLLTFFSLSGDTFTMFDN